MKLTLREVLPDLDQSNAGGLYNIKPLSSKLKGVISRRDWIRIIMAEGKLYRKLMGVDNYHEDDLDSYIDAFIRMDRIHITEDKVTIVNGNYCESNKITVEHFPSHANEILYGDIDNLTPKERTITHILGCQHTPIFSMEHVMLFDEIHDVNPVKLESHCRLQYLTEEAVEFAQARMEKVLHTKRSFFPNTFNWKLNTIKRYLSSQRTHKNALMAELEKRFTVKVSAKRQDPAKIYRKSPVTIERVLDDSPELLDIPIICSNAVASLAHGRATILTSKEVREKLGILTLNHSTLRQGVWGEDKGVGPFKLNRPTTTASTYEALEESCIKLIKSIV